MNSQDRIAILGGGNIGFSIAKGLSESGTIKENEILITNKKILRLAIPNILSNLSVSLFSSVACIDFFYACTWSFVDNIRTKIYFQVS